MVDGVGDNIVLGHSKFDGGVAKNNEHGEIVPEHTGRSTEFILRNTFYIAHRQIIAIIVLLENLVKKDVSETVVGQ